MFPPLRSAAVPPHDCRMISRPAYATSMPKLCGDTTVLHQNRQAFRGPSRHPDPAPIGSCGVVFAKQHLVAASRDNRSIYEAAENPNSILHATRGVNGRYYTVKVNASFR